MLANCHTKRRLNFQRLVFFFGILHAGSYPKTEKTEGGDFMALTRPKDSNPSESCQRNSATRFLFSHAKDGADGLVRGLKTAGVPPENLRQFGSCEKMENFA